MEVQVEGNFLCLRHRILVKDLKRDSVPLTKACTTDLLVGKQFVDEPLRTQVQGERSPPLAMITLRAV